VVREIEGVRNAVRLDKAGLDVADLTPELATALGYRDNLRGALIARVQPGGAAASAGLRPGMVVTRLERQAITTAAGLRDALDGAALQRGVLVQVVSPQGGTNFVVLKTGD
jgi:serine protease DegQ